MDLINTLKRTLLQRRELAGIPGFPPSGKAMHEPLYKQLAQQVRKEHAVYVSTVSSPEMAMSRQLALFLLDYCLAHRPTHLLDLGSGFSSYVLRLYQQHTPADKPVIVYSVDDHAAWLDKTRSYLESHGLSTDHLYTLEALQAQDLNGFFDLVLLDLNFVEVRQHYLAYSGELTAPEGVVVIDDVHKVEFLRTVKQQAQQHGFKLANIKKATHDRFGRFAIIMKR